MNTTIKLTSSIALASLAMSASAVDFSGYARAGISSTTGGGEATCFGNGADGHYVGRLGDECDSYLELGFGKEVYNKDGKRFYVQSMLSSNTGDGAQYNDYQSVVEPGAESSFGDIALRQLNVQATGVVEALPEATLWAGKRYYKRKDVSILDLFYLNNSGYGAGLENVDLGFSQFSAAWITSDNVTTSGQLNGNLRNMIQMNKFDLRFNEIDLGATSLDLALIYGVGDVTDNQSISGDESNDGILVTAEFTNELMGGSNHLVLQYGADAFGEAAFNNASGSAPNAFVGWDGTLDNSIRLINHGVVNLNSDVDMAYSALYATGETVSDSAVETDPSRLSLVVRPAYYWNDTMRTTLEVGYAQVQTSAMTESTDLQKIVIAQEFTAGRGAMARPSLRFYAGTFFGEIAEESRAASQDGADGDVRFGAQLEAWW